MDTTQPGWWSRHGWTVAILLTAFGLTLAIRTIFAYPIIAQYGPLYTYAGGSDSYYHSRVMQYIILTHHNLVRDPMLRFPVGAINPREPLFDWMNAILGLLFAPFFGGNAVVAGAWFLDLQAPLWAALSVFPIYLIGREVSGRRTGLIAVLIFPFLSASIDSSIFGYANYLSFYTFLILVVLYGYIRTVKAVGSRRWIESYRDPRQYWPGLRNFLRTERTAVKWAVFTGVSLGALALAWQGYTYDVVVIGVGVLVAMVIERVRRIDSFGLYVVTWIVGLVGFPMEMPYYLTQYGSLSAPGFATFFVLPALLFFGILILLLPFLLMRDIPWVFSIPLMVLVLGLGTLALAVFRPSLFTSLITGQGYFVKTLIYSTVAEAQAPSIDELIIGYGVFTFFLAFVGLALFGYLTVHHRFKRYLLVFLVFAILSIYLPISASKFFLLGSPAFALLPAEAIRRALEVGRYPELRRNVASLSDRRSQFSAFRKSFKVRHVVIIGVVVALLLPNIWISIDAGIPGNTKDQFAAQVAKTIPSWLSLNSSAPASNYFGAAGSSLDTPNQYDSAGYNWLAQQDTNVAPSNRPAFISWWDYGFQAIDQGDHPSVADNFQNGIDPAGQFLLSQNESQAIAVLAVTLLQAEQKASGLPYLPTALNQMLAVDGVNLTEFHNLLVNTSADYNLVVNNPGRYLPVDPSTLTDDNAMYIATEWYLANSLTLTGISRVYNDVQAYTGWSIRYAMSDTRLFPFSGTDTGIYYAPADLTGRVIDDAGLPSTYFNVTILGSNGQTYPAGQLPATVSAVDYYINYFAPFYNSMIYHIYIGYNGTDVGLSGGIPGLSGAAQSSPLEPGWMLQHFMVVYKTAYYCPQANATDGSACFSATNEPAAVANAKANNGTADTSAVSYFQGGESMLAYYPGETLYGTLETSNGGPVGGARVTVFDQWGIPHMTTVSASDGSFSLVLPPGNDTINVTAGTLQGLSQQGNIILKTIPFYVPNALGYNLQAPAISQTFQLASGTVSGLIYWNTANNTTYDPVKDTVTPGAQFVLWGDTNQSRLTATTDASGAFNLANVAPGTYHSAVVYQGHNYSESEVIVTPGAAVNSSAGLPAGRIFGNVTSSSGVGIPGATVTAGTPNGTYATAYTNGTGGFNLTNLGPGNYTVWASVPSAGLRSPGPTVDIAAPGAQESLNLTAVPSTLVSFSVQANGQPVANIPVRFTPIATFGNQTTSPLSAIEAGLANATVVTTGPNGGATVALPAGQYAVYAVGYVGSQLYAGVSSVSTPAGLATVVPTLQLTPAVSLSGTVSAVGSSGANETVVTAYAPSGGQVTTIAAASGGYSLLLPAGSYGVLSLTGASTPGTPLYAAIAPVTLTGTTRLSLTPSSAVTAHFSVGATLGSGAFYPAADAAVTISAGPTGPAVPLVADANGSVTAYLPTTLPLSAPSYCVGATSLGFRSASTCGISPNGLASMSSYPLTIQTVPTNLTVLGLPSGTTVTVNFTAESTTAVSVINLTGGPRFSLALAPGVYGVGAKAVIGNGTVVYLPSQVLSTTIPFGATRSTLTLTLLYQVNSTGTLALPSGVPIANVTVALSSPLLNLSTNGTDYTTDGFYAAPGTYTATVTGTGGGTTYSNVTRVTVSSTGTITPKVVLNRAGLAVTGALTGASGASLSLNTTLTLVGPGGSRIVTSVNNGAFTATLPPNQTYFGFANASGTVIGPNGTYNAAWSSAAGASCTVTPSSERCAISMVGRTLPVFLNGTLTSPGVPGRVPGSLRLLGPYPTDNITVVSTTNGSFSAAVLPGAYSVYASGGSGAEPLGGFASLLLLPSSVGNASIVLSPTWTDTISVTNPNASGATAGPASVYVQDPFGRVTLFKNVTPGAPITIGLPVGVYSISAVAPGSLNGVVSNAVAHQSVRVTNSNLGTVLALAVPTLERAGGTLVGPTSATVAGGGVATFGYTVRDAGNVPIMVQAVGSPAYWTFNFTNPWVNLTPNGPTASGEVRITVPTGTPVNHPNVLIEFETANGTIVGSVSPSPQIKVLGYYGVSIGKSTQGVTVSPTSAVVPFYVANSGNQGETVLLTIVDQARLSGLGWSATIGATSAGQGPTRYIAAGVNTTQRVNLTTTTSAFAPPVSVTVEATVLNASGAVQSTVTIGVPTVAIRPSPSPGQPQFTVTGPSVGSPPNALPDWVVPVLVFVPSLVLIAAVVTYRWWRTRRWTRR